MMPFDFCTVWTRLLMKKDNVICNEKDLQLGTEYFFPEIGVRLWRERAFHPKLFKVEGFFFSLRLCHGVFLQSENYKLRTKRTYCCGKQCIRAHKCKFCVAKCLLGNPKPFLICTVPVQATRSFRTLLNVSMHTLSENLGRFLVQASMA